MSTFSRILFRLGIVLAGLCVLALAGALLVPQHPGELAGIATFVLGGPAVLCFLLAWVVKPNERREQEANMAKALAAFQRAGENLKHEDGSGAALANFGAAAEALNAAIKRGGKAP